jgi:hypothetical protein
VFAAHELFHFFVIAGSACHVYFMHAVVVPVMKPEPAPALSQSQTADPSRPASGLVATIATNSKRGRSWRHHFPARPQWWRRTPASSPRSEHTSI